MNKKELEQKYWELIWDYRNQLKEIRQAERKGEERKFILFLDRERAKAHDELRRIAPLIGRDVQDVNFDILSSEGNLQEYHLSEFSVTRTFDIQSPEKSKQGYIRVLKDDKLEKPKSSSEYKYQQDSKETNSLELFISFGEETSWHLFDSEAFFQRQPDNLERRRRAKDLVERTSGKAKFIEIELPDTFHRGVKMFGVATSKDNFHSVINQINSNRKEISIKQEYFDQNKIREDFERILKDDIQRIFDYGWIEFETPRDNMEAYFERINDGNFKEEFKEIARAVFKKKEEDLRELEIRREIAQETERIDEDSKKDILLPKRESTRRRK